MKKLIMVIVLAVVLCGCVGMEEYIEASKDRIKYACINGHLYIANYTYSSHIVFTPLFAADSDVPMLVQCQKE